MMTITVDLKERENMVEATTIYAGRPEESISACACRGPQNGEPRCPCRMRNIVKVDDKYYEVLQVF